MEETEEAVSRGEAMDARRFRKPPLYPTELRGLEVQQAPEGSESPTSATKAPQPPSAAPSGFGGDAAGVARDAQADKGALSFSPSPALRGLRGRPPEERIAALVQRGEPDECWLFLGNAVDGYGRVESFGKAYLAHRVVLEQKLGRALLPSEVAMHACDVRRCCNPAHLSAGSVADNNRDAVSKGRNARGARNGSAKLLDEQVKRIRERRAAGESAKVIAADFGISDRLVYYVSSGQRWKHITAEVPHVR